MDFNTFLEKFDVIAEAPGGIPKLRSLILELAVRGKLVPQNSEDEPAIFLVKQTIESKQELLKAKKIRKTETLFPSQGLIKTKVPLDGWVIAPLGMLCLLLVDGSHNPPPKQEKGIPMLSGQNVRDGYITLDASRYITEKEYEHEMSRTPIQAGDVFLSIVGSIGRSAVVPEEFPRCALQRSIALIRTDLYAHYLSLFLRSPIALQYYEQHGKGTAQKGIYLNKLSELEVVIPPLAEQKRIVEKVDELMALCDRYEAAKQTRDSLRQKLRGSAIASLMNSERDKELDTAWAFVRDNWQNLSQQPGDVDSLRKSVLQLALRGKLVPQDYTDESASVLLGKISSSKKELIQQGKIKKSALFSKPLVEQQFFELPKTWKWARLDDITLSITDGEHATPPRVSNPEVPLGTAKNIRDGFLDFNNTDYVNTETAEKCWRRCKPTHNDILMVCVGATTGRLCLIKEPPDFVIVRSVALIRTFANFIYPEYVALAINSPLLQQQVWSNVKQSAQPCLYINKIQILTLPIPPLAEQKRIVAKVDELMQLCGKLEASLRQSQQWAESLAASAISHLTI